MLRLFSTIRKDLLILFRDRSGIAIMFLMPMALIVIMSVIQDAPFRDYQEMKIPILLVNSDKGVLGKTIEDSLKKSKLFDVNDSVISETEAKQIVAKGDYKIGIIVSANASEELNKKVEQFVSKTFASAGIPDLTQTADTLYETTPEIILYFSTDIKKSFKNSVQSSIKQFSSKIETQTLLDYFKKEFKKQNNDADNFTDEFISINEKNVMDGDAENLQMNSVQHNVPAWTMFGMFFIVISLAGGIIKEREDGSYLRILTMPGNYFTIMIGKISAYLIICLTQCLLMLMVGIYFLPLLGLPELVIGTNIFAIATLAVCSGLAATGYGIMIGTVFNTHQQSSTFGAISVVILAALGGIWVPVYVMPETIRVLAESSPLYWGLNAFHDLFLRAGTVQTIFPYLLKLLLFFCLTIVTSFFFNKIKYT